MTNQQVYLLLAVPLLFNGVLTGILMLHINSKFSDAREVWKAELKRVEEVLDARLKHLEEHR